VTHNFFTVEEFAEILKVCTHTVLKDIRSGRINAMRSSGGKRASFRIPKTEVERLLVMAKEEI
jgi:excisionase family DNA binding protein